MLVLLPPSETKSTRTRGRALDHARLSCPGLSPARDRVLDAVASVSGRDDAPTVLGVSPNLTAEIARNTALRTSPAIPVEQLYTGVLSLRDAAPSYRLSMSVNLPDVGPLAGHWRSVLDESMQTLAGKGLIVDCRSSTYAAAWTPSGDLAGRWVQIRVPGATHMAKHTRGLVTRAICELGLDPRRPEQLADGLADRFEVGLTSPAASNKPWILDTVVRG